MIQADDAKIAVRLDSREAEAELERLRAALEGLDVTTEKETAEKTEEAKQEKDTTYTLGGVLRNAYDVVMSVLQTSLAISPLIRGYVKDELFNLLHDSVGLPAELAAVINGWFQSEAEPRMKKLEDDMIRWSSLLESIVPAVDSTADIWKAAALFGEGMGPTELIETFGLFMDLNQQNQMMKKDVARRTYEQYGSAWRELGDKLGKEYSEDKLPAALGELFEQSIYK